MVAISESSHDKNVEMRNKLSTVRINLVINRMDQNLQQQALQGKCCVVVIREFLLNQISQYY